MPGGLEGCDAAALDRFAGELDGRLQMLRADGGVAGLDASIRLAGFQELKNRGDHDPGALEGRLAVADVGVHTDIVAPFNRSAHLTSSIPAWQIAVNLEARPKRTIVLTAADTETGLAKLLTVKLEWTASAESD